METNLPPTRVEAIAKAQAMVDEDAKKGHDAGTCVLFAGIYFTDVARPKRQVWPEVAIRAPFQGNIGSYEACKRALSYLQAWCFPAEWYDGVMD